MPKWNVTTRIWRGRNVCFFAAFCYSCLDFKALLAIFQLEITAYLPSLCRREAIRAVIIELTVHPSCYCVLLLHQATHPSIQVKCTWWWNFHASEMVRFIPSNAIRVGNPRFTAILWLPRNSRLKMQKITLTLYFGLIVRQSWSQAINFIFGWGCLGHWFSRTWIALNITTLEKQQCCQQHYAQTIHCEGYPEKILKRFLKQSSFLNLSWGSE